MCEIQTCLYVGYVVPRKRSVYGNNVES